jgi:AbrB family looped-hinge helix DNA binding protein
MAEASTRGTRNAISWWVYPTYNAIMAIWLTMDKSGRVVIPKAVRDELGLEPGDSLEMESAGEVITLRPVRGTEPLVKEHGVWVFHAGQPLPASATDALLQQLRAERDLSNSRN